MTTTQNEVSSEPSRSEANSATLGPVARLSGVIFSPGDTFQDINRRPTWLVPMLLAMVASSFVWVFIEWWASPDWDRIARDQITARQSAGTQSEDDIERALEGSRAIRRFLPVVVALGPFVVNFIVTGVFALGMLLLQAQTTFKKVLSVVCWSNAVIALIGGLALAAALMIQDQESLSRINPARPETMLPSSVGALVSLGSSPVLNALAVSIDFFTIWSLILFSIGLAAVSGVKRMNSKTTGTMVFGFWILWVLMKMGFAYLGG